MWKQKPARHKSFGKLSAHDVFDAAFYSSQCVLPLHMAQKPLLMCVNGTLCYFPLA